MNIQDTELDGVKLITLKSFEDFRGSYIELYDSKKYKSFDLNFVQDDLSHSFKYVLRGLHGDFETYKLVTVLKGNAYCLIADNRKNSPTYKKWQSFNLSCKNLNQLLLPPGVGNSMLAMSDEVLYYYKQTTHFVDGQQFTIKWNDPDWNFWWPISNPILSLRDFRGNYE